MPTEPSPCQDCGRDTTPPVGHWEWYMVHDSVWKAAGLPHDGGHMGGIGYCCIRCLERRLGRPLTAADFTDAPVNWITANCSLDLRAALSR